VHKLPKKSKPRRSHYKSEKAWVDACYKHGTACGLKAQEYILDRDDRRIIKSCQRTQRRAQRKQGTPLSVSRALCPITIPVNITAGMRHNEAQMVGV
jgi:hypothetical protein